MLETTTPLATGLVSSLFCSLDPSTDFTGMLEQRGRPTPALSSNYGGVPRAEGILSAVQTADITDLVILALDEPYAKITTTYVGADIIFVVAPVIKDVDGTTDLAPLLHASAFSWDGTTVGIDTISADSKSLLNVYRVQPVTPIIDTITYPGSITCTPTGICHDGGIKIPVNAGTEWYAPNTFLNIGYIIDMSINKV